MQRAMPGLWFQLLGFEFWGVRGSHLGLCFVAFDGLGSGVESRAYPECHDF